MWCGGTRAILVAAGIVAGATSAQGAPITFNTALPVAEGEFVFRNQSVFANADDDPSAANRDLERFANISVLGYGATSDLALFGVLPYVDTELRTTPPGGGRVTREASGIGDALLFGRYTIVRRDAPGQNFRVAPFAGVELPTGESSRSDALGPLPPALQPGSGSFDPVFGLIATYQTLDFEIDAQASHRINTEGSGRNLGDEVRLDGALQYRLYPSELGEGVPGFLYGVIEGNFAYRERNRIDGVTNPNSGGASLLISPGLQYVTQRWIAEAIVQVPVFQDLNGTALEQSYTVRAGFRVNY